MCMVDSTYIDIIYLRILSKQILPIMTTKVGVRALPGLSGKYLLYITYVYIIHAKYMHICTEGI